LATAQVRPGDLLIIDRHPGEKGLVFLKDTDQQSFCAQMPFVASLSGNLTAAEATA
jgi:hydrogenase maturation factor